MTEHAEHRIRGYRRHLSITEAAVLFALILQIAAIVWGAATLTATVAHLSETVRELQGTNGQLRESIERLSADVRVLQDHDTLRRGK